jgi:uncharacterized protein (DUF608 family)
MFLGGIGAPVCSRNLLGEFDRWHLQPGHHVRQVIDSAFVGLYWKRDHNQGYSRLDASWKGEREVHSLFPVVQEFYRSSETGMEVILEFFTAMTPDAQELPVWYVTAAVHNSLDSEIEAHVVFSFPNTLGWRTQQITSTQRCGTLWPSQTHAGNTAFMRSGRAGGHTSYQGSVQTRFPDRQVSDELEGETAVLSFGPTYQLSSCEPCVYDGSHAITRDPKQQKYTSAWAEHYFSIHGHLPETGKTWTAHWDEALASSVERGAVIQPGGSQLFCFLTAWDMPIVRFAGGRMWDRKYTRTYGTSGRNSLSIAVDAMKHYQGLRDEVSTWHRDICSSYPEICKALINELYFINAGGSAWVAQQSAGQASLEQPLLGTGEHAALLEGFDVGYFYYNTSDLWYYAWYGAYRAAPSFAASVFNDLLESIPKEISEKRVFYRSEAEGQILTYGKVPHDLGSPMEDPWHGLNGYQNRDDSNRWKDHNPGFILSYILYCRISGTQISAAAWDNLTCAAQQFSPWDPLPFHDEFGDSTWDNLGIRGYSSFSSLLYLGSLAALRSTAEQFGDTSNAQTYAESFDRAEEAAIDLLYKDGFFHTSDRGTYAACTMADSILGLYYAHAAGLFGYFKHINVEMIRSHLLKVFDTNMMQFQSGRLGPLLLAQEGRTEFPGDGGDELQVNEVLIGSAWLFAAMLDYFDMKEQAITVSDALQKTIYEDSGLQFRTAAAINGRREFRAPMNMRPLSIWLFDLNAHVKKKRKGY